MLVIFRNLFFTTENTFLQQQSYVMKNVALLNIGVGSNVNSTRPPSLYNVQQVIHQMYSL